MINTEYKYKVYDLYEGKIILGHAKNMKEIKKLAREEYNATDGECDIYYAELNPETMKYKFIDRKHIDTI